MCACVHGANLAEGVSRLQPDRFALRAVQLGFALRAVQPRLIKNRCSVAAKGSVSDALCCMLSAGVVWRVRW